MYSLVPKEPFSSNIVDFPLLQIIYEYRVIIFFWQNWWVMYNRLVHCWVIAIALCELLGYVWGTCPSTWPCLDVWGSKPLNQMKNTCQFLAMWGKVNQCPLVRDPNKLLIYVAFVIGTSKALWCAYAPKPCYLVLPVMKHVVSNRIFSLSCLHEKYKKTSWK